ncbi:MAG: hypothetical protein V1861_01010 [Candidatus Micrarchaeota archaeon]
MRRKITKSSGAPASAFGILNDNELVNDDLRLIVDAAKASMAGAL